MSANEKTALDAIVAASIGRAAFAERHGLDTPERREQLSRVLSLIEQHKIEVIRFSFVDTHGHVRTRPFEARHFGQAARNGIPFTTALLAMDSANHIFQPVFSADGGFGRASMGGAGDMLAVADLSTFRILPWAKNCASVFADLYLSDGEPCPFDPRQVMRKACKELEKSNFLYMGGVEVECHIFRVTDPKLSLEACTQPPQPAAVEAWRHGYQYMSQLVLDEYEPIVEAIRRALIDVGLPLRTVECEWGPGQLEITLDPLIGIEAADAVILMRMAVKQVARRMGLIASFMTKPGLPNVYSCGWHLHESLAYRDGSGNAFVSPENPMSDLGLHFVGGILNHARAGTAFSNPTINGYKRLNNSTHIENRSGEPLANPYLYMASQIFAGLDGIAKKADPGSPLSDPYAQINQPLMPGSLMEAIEALATSDILRASMGGEFVDHFVSMKRHEIGRFLSTVTDWEHREYFEAF